jgi:hypothetical protein
MLGRLRGERHTLGTVEGKNGPSAPYPRKKISKKGLCELQSIDFSAKFPWSNGSAGYPARH